MYDYLIVGAGFTGLVLAERLNSFKKKVLVIEKRNHIGGNSYDYYNEKNILVHKYGPHYFRTNYDKVFSYLSKFTKWRPCNYKVKTCINGKLYPFPINLNTINQFFKINLQTEEEAMNFIKSKRLKISNPKNAEEQVLSTLGKELYDAFFKNYTKKQWNTDPKNLDPSITARIPLRYDTNDKYFNDKIQAMPLNGYFSLFEKMSKGIEIRLNTDFLEVKRDIQYNNLIYTGPIDEFFEFKYGRLPYRSLKFKHENYNKPFYQNWVQINYPNDYDYTRIVEIKHVTGQRSNNTTIVKEYPSDSGDPFYPIPSEKNNESFQKYWGASKKLKNTYFLGRLATYRYLNMDQVVKEALEFVEKIKLA